jgi:selenide, water dikinase
VLSRLPKLPANENLLVGYDTADDAGVYKLTDEIALVQTVDFFTPVVDDPYLFGKISAINSLSDVWAMGGVAVTALAIAAFPVKTIGLDILAEIARGGAEILAEVGVSLLGGHTVEDEELKFGYAVTGVIHPEKVITNSGARPGDALVLTKRLGTGIISSGIKFERSSPAAVEAAISSMLQPNRMAAQAMQAIGVHAATDITGFGLLGHAFEMARGSGATLKIDSSKILLLPQVFELLAENIKTRGDHTNREYIGDAIEFAVGVAPELQSVLFDPQTSGGMLISLSPEKSQTLVNDLRERGVEAVEIGRIFPSSEKLLQIY